MKKVQAFTKAQLSSMNFFISFAKECSPVRFVRRVQQWFVAKFHVMKFASLLILTSLATSAFSQEEHLSRPCDPLPALKSLLKNGTIKELYAFAGYEDSFASSILKPGKPNQYTRAEYDRMNESDKTKYEQWSCQYGASNISDALSKTAWVEGASGTGAGEVVLLTVQLDVTKKIEIWSGYGANDMLFKANNRPMNIGVHIVRSMPGPSGQYGTVHHELTVVASGKVLLKDVNAFQPLALPNFKKETFHRDDNDWDYSYWLLLEIIDVYAGSKYQDTCITDVRNVR